MIDEQGRIVLDDPKTALPVIEAVERAERAIASREMEGATPKSSLMAGAALQLPHP